MTTGLPLLELWRWNLDVGLAVALLGWGPCLSLAPLAPTREQAGGLGGWASRVSGRPGVPCGAGPGATTMGTGAAGHCSFPCLSSARDTVAALMQKRAGPRATATPYSSPLCRAHAKGPTACRHLPQGPSQEASAKLPAG